MIQRRRAATYQSAKTSSYGKWIKWIVCLVLLIRFYTQRQTTPVIPAPSSNTTPSRPTTVTELTRDGPYDASRSDTSQTDDSLIEKSTADTVKHDDKPPTKTEGETPITASDHTETVSVVESTGAASPANSVTDNAEQPTETIGQSDNTETEVTATSTDETASISSQTTTEPLSDVVISTLARKPADQDTVSGHQSVDDARATDTAAAERTPAAVNDSASPADESSVEESGTVVVQIGANDGSPGGNDDIVRKLLERNTTRALLVEANPMVFAKLQATIQQTYPDGKKIAVQALVCQPSAAKTKLKFWAVNDTRLFQDFHNNSLPHWLLYQLGSVDYNATALNVEDFLEKQRKLNTTLHFPGADYYMYSMDMPCTSLSQILKQYSISPTDVHILAVDVEGHDAEVITNAFSEFPTELDPAVVIFEQKVMPSESLVALRQMLEDRGYDIDCNRKRPGRKPDRRRCPLKLDAIATKKNSTSYRRIKRLVEISS